MLPRSGFSFLSMLLVDAKPIKQVSQSSMPKYPTSTSGRPPIRSAASGSSLVALLPKMSATGGLLVAVCMLCVYSAFGQLPKARFEYKYSFKGPHLVQRDNSIPFWEYSGGKFESTRNVQKLTVHKHPATHVCFAADAPHMLRRFRQFLHCKTQFMCDDCLMRY